MEDNESCGSGVHHHTSSSSSIPGQSRHHRQKLEVYNEILRRLNDSGNEEAMQPGFSDQLWAHFNRLPSWYTLHVNVERAEDVLMHMRLLHLAHDPANRPQIEIRLVQETEKRKETLEKEVLKIEGQLVNEEEKTDIGTEISGGSTAREFDRQGLDRAFFACYNDVWVHRSMIQDTSRMEAYQSAILFHRDRFEGKVIIDVGCGTGILSIFCARAGARKVYAIEASGMALHAKSIVEANELSDVITVLHTTVEDACIAGKVDVIISEWMGHMLFQENMLPTIILARDRWLSDGGLMLPSSATLYMAPFSDRKRYHKNIGFWSNVDGVDMSALIPLTKDYLCDSPSVETVEEDSLLGEPHQVIRVDMYSIGSIDAIETSFRFRSHRSAPLHGFVLWFDAEFCETTDDPLGDDESYLELPPPVLSTAPGAPSTHWQQTLIDCYDPVDLVEDQVIDGTLKIGIDKENHRLLQICFKYMLDGEIIELVTKF